jgi:hypothetical protein
MRIRIVTEGASSTRRVSPFRPPPIQFKLLFEL